MERALGSRYRLGAPLGSGAMGQVFTGSDKDDHEFAFKILRSDLTGNPDVVARFLQERSILVGLRHENLVPVRDLVVEGETVAIVMDLVSGGDLRAYLREAGTLLPAEVARIGAGIAMALAEVHRAGVVHRDVKPENVLMDDTSASRTPRLTDFGIASLADSSSAGRSSLLAGTPQYVAPELAEGEQATPSSDLYSLGIVLYEMSCGVTPFAGKSMLQVIRQHAECEPGRPDGIPDLMWDMIRWLLAKGPRARPQNALQVANVLEAMIPDLLPFPIALPLSEPPVASPISHGLPTQGAIPTTPRVPVARINTPSNPGMGVPMPKPKRKRKVAVLLVLLMLLGGGFVVWNKRSSSEDSAAPGPSGQAAPSATSGAAVAPAATTTSAEPVLTVAPDLVGKTLAAAQDALPNTLQLEIIDSIEQTAKPGNVVEQEPKAGEKLNGKLKLVVARDAVKVYLDALRPVTGQWSSQSAAGSVAGQVLTHTVRDALGCSTEAQSVEYNLAKGFRKLAATAGIDDNSSDTEIKVQLEILGDGRQLSSSILEFGKATPVDADLSGVLRLKIQWQPLGSGRCYSGDAVDLGEARLLGLPGEVPSASATPTN